MNRVFPQIIIVASLGLATACGTVQALEGNIYMAGDNGANVTTIVQMNDRLVCPVPSKSIAFATRETYFKQFKGGGEVETYPLTEVAHTGKACGANDFIEGNPNNNGWEMIKPGTVEWLRALDEICQAKDVTPTEGKLFAQTCAARK